MVNSVDPDETLHIAGLVANGVDPDEMPHSVASHLGLHCLLTPVCLYLYGNYGMIHKLGKSRS